MGRCYQWSNYQLEYSRNLWFCAGRIMEEVFQSVMDRTRAALNAQTVKTLFGRQRRPYSRIRRLLPNVSTGSPQTPCWFRATAKYL
jgi:hypothetical protein